MVDQVFETTDAYKELYKESLRKFELSPADLLVHTLAASILDGFSPIGSKESDWQENGAKRTTGMSKSMRIKMYQNARQLVRVESLAQKVIRKFIIHVCGTGPKILLHDSNSGVESRLKKLFPDFSRLAQFVIARTLLHGEYYMLHFPIEESKYGGHPQLRSVIPDLCTKIIRIDDWSDIPIIKGYEFKPLRRIKTKLGKGILPVENVSRFVIHEEMNDGLYGVSLFYTLMKELPRYTDWLQSRQLRAKTDALFLIIRYLKGLSAGETTELPDRPMIIDANMNQEDWKPITAPSGARDASVDGYEFRLRVAQGVGLPEHDVSGNAMYAGQMGREGFPAQLYEYYQNLFDQPLREMVAKTIGISTEELILQWPRVDTRDRTQLVAEVRQLAGERKISRAEVHRRLGYDHDLIEKELEQELIAEGLPAPGGVPMADFTPPVVPVKPEVLPIQQPQIEVTLPSAVTSQPLGLTAENIIDEVPELSMIGIGLDYGYADEGAGVIGGVTLDGTFAVIGELRFSRAPLAEWVATVKNLQVRYPKLNDIWTGKDRPELIDNFKAAGFNVETLFLPQDEEIKTRLEQHTILIHQDCKRVIDALIPQLKELNTQMHSKPAKHHYDAFMYLFLGLTIPQQKEADNEARETD